MTDPAFLSRFTPSRTSPEILERIFVQREDLAKDTEERIVDSVTKGGKHQLLFVGPRGSGKTHFVTLLFHRLQARENLRDRLRIAWLAEDETTTTFFKLLLRIYHALQQRYPGEFPAPDNMMLQSMDVEARIRWLTRTLIEKLSGRTLLVILENLDERFKDLGDEGQKRWRAFLQEHVVTTTLATSQKLFAGVARRVSPFFGFFQVEHLEPLKFDDAILLMTKIAEEVKCDQELAAFLRSPTGRSRVRALYHLSGGNHRIYIILSEFITRDSLDELIGPFERMLDELTPYYQARLDSLSTQQREIIEFLARARYAVPVKEIASELFLPHQTVTAQLKELKEKGYVLSNQVGREARYELTEPLMRLCVEVKDNHRQPVRLLVDFLRLWYSREQLAQRLKEMSSLACVERQYLEESLSTIDRGEVSRVFCSVLDDLRVQLRTADPAALVPILEEAFAALGHVIKGWFGLDHYQQEAGDPDVALASYNAIQLDPDDAAAWFSKGSILSSLGRDVKALRCFERSIELAPNDASSWQGKGNALIKLGREEDALRSYERSIELNPNVANSWFNTGAVLGRLGREEDALRGVERSIELDPNVAAVWLHKGNVLRSMGRAEEALRSFERSIDLDPDDPETWEKLGTCLIRLNRFDEALAAIERALALKPDNPSASYSRVEALFALDHWEDGFASLGDSLAHFPLTSADDECDLKAILLAVLSSTKDRTLWKERIDRLVRMVADAGVLNHLGRGLVDSLKSLRANALDSGTLRAWNEVWNEVGESQEALQLPLRLYEVGIRYLETGDRRVLRDLVSEERRIVEEALGLEPADDPRLSG